MRKFALIAFLFNFSEKICSVSRREFISQWMNSGKNDRNDKILKFLLQEYEIVNPNEESLLIVKDGIRKFSAKIKERFEKCQRKRNKFFVDFQSWIDGDDLKFVFQSEQPLIHGGPGRPEKPFSESTHKTKKRKIQGLLQSSTEQLVKAAEVSLRKSGQRDAASLLKKITDLDPCTSTTATDIKNVLKNHESVTQRKYSPEEALALFLDCRLTKCSYIRLRKKALEAGHDLYPSYHALQKAKKSCYPQENCFTISETRVEVSLHQLIYLTIQRLCLALSTVLKHLTELGHYKFTLDIKWGCDGSSGHSNYKQRFSEVGVNDDFLILFSFVPLKLQYINNNQNPALAWQNPSPASTRLCRAFKFLYEKETPEVTRAEIHRTIEDISKLKALKVFIDEKEIEVTCNFLLTMVDGKICNALTETTSTQKCYICGATPKTMSFDNATTFKPAIQEQYGFGLSTLHAWIRSFEFLLHIGYKIEVKKWAVTNPTDKKSVESRKKEIQNKFKADLGLNVDKPKPGFGSTNDGNTARTFFKNPAVSAAITGVDETLIRRFSVLLLTLSSGYDINAEKFQKYATDTKDMYMRLYGWYYMPVTIHKILIHGAEIIKFYHLPIGQLTEEAMEARHKDCRRFREHNTQKKSRVTTNKDLMNMLLVSSDPLINDLREKPLHQKARLNQEVVSLLNSPLPPPALSTVTYETYETSDSDSVFNI